MRAQARVLAAEVYGAHEQGGEWDDEGEWHLVNDGDFDSSDDDGLGAPFTPPPVQGRAEGSVTLVPSGFFLGCWGEWDDMGGLRPVSGGSSDSERRR